MFQAGFARVDITPPLGTPMAGYFYVRHADGVLDPIELNALAVNNGEETAILIAADVLYIMENAATPIREGISAATGVPVNQIFVHGLHPHTSIRIGSRPGREMDGISGEQCDSAYLDVLYRKFADVARMAMDDLRDAEMEYGEQETEKQLSFVRRYWMKDGSLKSNPGWQNPDIVRPADDADNTVRVIRFKRSDAKDIAFVNFWTHPDVIGGTKFSADWPGFVRRYTEADLGVHCLVFNGPQGDTNHLDFSIPKDIWHHDRYGFSGMMGRTIADAVLKVWDKTEPRKDGKIWGEVQMVLTPTNMQGMDEIDRWKRVKVDYDSGKNRNLSQNDLGTMGRVSDLENERIFQMVPVSVMGIGDVVFVGFGGEAFTYYGKMAMEAAPDLTVIPLTLTNGGQGYLPTAKAFDEGGYEAFSSRFTPVLQEKLIGAVQEMLEAYREKTE
ncbi:MAG: hypothetical protein IJC19_05085 [Clostridia bacterium]|nr:hypothetical protein [Clostridia bacterium]